MKPFKFIRYFLIACCCFSFSSYVAADSNSAFDEEQFLTEFNQLVADKNFTEVTRELREMLQELYAFDPAQSLDINIEFSTATSDVIDYATPFVLPSATEISAKLTDYFAGISFSQTIYDQTSHITLSSSSYQLDQQVEGYANYAFPAPTISIGKVFLQDGTTLVANQNNQINSNKRIVAIELLAEYAIPAHPVTTLRLSTQPPNQQHGIELIAIVQNQAILELSKSPDATILYIEGIDKQGNYLASGSHSSYTFNYDSQELAQGFYQKLLQQIDDKTITSIEMLKQYLHANLPRFYQEQEQVIDNQTTTLKYRFAAPIVAINVYLVPSIKTLTYSKKITQSTSNYINKLIVAYRDNHNQQGLLNEQGNWVVQPQYLRIMPELGAYYTIVSEQQSDGQLYWLNPKTQQLQLQPFYMMSPQIYHDHLVIVNRDRYNNFIQGLLDLTTNQLILPTEYDQIEITEHFYITDRYNQEQSQHYREVYNLKNNDRIFAGNVNVQIDKDNFITEQEVCTTQEPAFYLYSSSRADQVQHYCYNEYVLYDQKGNQLNTQPYQMLSEQFSQDDLLLVSVQQQPLFIDRQGQKAKIDLSAYKQVEAFSQGLAAVKCKSNNRYGYINTKGKLTIACQYDSANYFQGGTAIVEYNHQYQLIRPNDSVVKVFTDRLSSYSNQQDNQHAYYNFMDGERYDHNGELMITQ